MRPSPSTEMASGLLGHERRLIQQVAQSRLPRRRRCYRSSLRLDRCAQLASTPNSFNYRAFPPWSLVVASPARYVRRPSRGCPLRFCLPFNCPHVHSAGAQLGVGDETGPAVVIPSAGVWATRDRIVCTRCYRSSLKPLHQASTRRPSLIVPSSHPQPPRGLAANKLSSGHFGLQLGAALAWSAFHLGWLVFDLPFHTLGLGCRCGGNTTFMHNAALRLGIKTNGDPGRQEQGNSRPLKTDGLGPVTFPPRRASNSLPAAPLSFRSRLRNIHLSSALWSFASPFHLPPPPLSDTLWCALDLDSAPTELEGSSNPQHPRL